MAIGSATWTTQSGSDYFQFDKNTNEITTYITVGIYSPTNIAPTIELWYGLAAGGTKVFATPTAVWTSWQGSSFWQATYTFDFDTWLEIRDANGSAHISVGANVTDHEGYSAVARATVNFAYHPIITNSSITSNFSDPNVFIQGVTSTLFSVEAEGQLGASIISGTGELGDTSISLSKNKDVWTGTIAPTSRTGRIGVMARVRDNYGLGNSYSKAITILAHDVPTITTDIFRCDSNGEADAGGNYLSVTVYANSVPAQLGIKSLEMEGTAGNVVDEFINSGQTYIIGDGLISSDNAYSLTFTAIDNGGEYSGGTALSSTLSVGVPKVVRVINVHDGGDGIAFGKMASEGILDSAWDIHSDGTVSATSQLNIKSDFSGRQVPYVIFRNQDDKACGSMEMNYRYVGSNNYHGRLQFRSYSASSSTYEPLSTREVYQLPTPDNDLASNKTYDILTTKNAVTVAQGGTGQTGLETTTSGVLTISTSGITLVAQTVKKWGKMVQATFKLAGTIASGGTVSGTIASGWRPSDEVNGVGYYNTSALVCKLYTGGSFRVRNTGSASQTGTNSDPLQVSVTYLLP